MTRTASAAAILERLKRVRRIMLSLPDVTGVGFGWKERSGQITDVAAWRVYVTKKLHLTDLSSAQTIPACCEGLLTDVIPVSSAIGTMQVATAADLRPGVTLSNLRGVLREQAVGPNTSGFGTLGFFALLNGIRRREVVLVSNRHVLLAQGARRGDSIYAPVFSRRGETCVISASDLDPVAEVMDEGAEENHSFHYGNEPPEDYFVDCATARLLVAPAEQRSYQMPNSTPVPIRGVTRMHPLDVLGRRTPQVRKVGSATGVTFGCVVDVCAPVETSSGVQRQHNIMIRGIDGPFVSPGDSGALVINESNQGIGMIWGRSDRNPNVAYACHIHPVLDRLGVTLMSRGLA